MERDAIQTMRSIRLATSLAVIVPSIVVAVAFLTSSLSHATSGAGLSEANRPIGFLMMAVAAAGCWIIGTSGMFSLFVATSRLPAAVRVSAIEIVFGMRSTPPRPHNLDEPFITRHESRVSVGGLLILAFFTFPLFLFLAPLLLGWLLRPGVYRPLEMTAVGAMGVVVVAWTAFLLLRAVRWHRADASTQRPSASSGGGDVR